DYGALNLEQVDFLKNIKDSSNHLLELINNILDISQIEAGEIKIVSKKINLYSLIPQIISSLKPLYKKKGLFFKIKGLEYDKIINTDPIRFKEILYNLISNAIKFTDEGGIILKIRELEGSWEFKIKDTGIGIAEENFDLIFKEFKQIKSPYINSGKGTGLGLPLTKKLVNLLNGEIYFFSKLGEGSTFTFLLPKKTQI
ncbi:MAG: hypothetical protein GF353_04700, partial [Candidatus Lokiarchaeota archaeon]|nr:hypothetical protein [Candidatus Lokiarchaeota archaeon]